MTTFNNTFQYPLTPLLKYNSRLTKSTREKIIFSEKLEKNQ